MMTATHLIADGEQPQLSRMERGREVQLKHIVVPLMPLDAMEPEKPHQDQVQRNAEAEALLTYRMMI